MDDENPYKSPEYVEEPEPPKIPEASETTSGPGIDIPWRIFPAILLWWWGVADLLCGFVCILNFALVMVLYYLFVGWLLVKAGTCVWKREWNTAVLIVLVRLILSFGLVFLAT